MREQERLEHRRARQAANSKAYRARQKAAGPDTPKRNTRSTSGRLISGYQVQPGNIAERAFEFKKAALARQRDALRGLPDIRNPEVSIRISETEARGLPKRYSREGLERQAKAIRDSVKAQKLEAVGSARKRQLVSELAENDRLYEALANDSNRARFQALSNRIAKATGQSLAILFQHLEGQGLYTGALDRIEGSPESRDVQEGLAMLEELAEQSEKADAAYAPRAIGRLRV